MKKKLIRKYFPEWAVLWRASLAGYLVVAAVIEENTEIGLWMLANALWISVVILYIMQAKNHKETIRIQGELLQRFMEQAEKLKDSLEHIKMRPL